MTASFRPDGVGAVLIPHSYYHPNFAASKLPERRLPAVSPPQSAIFSRAGQLLKLLSNNVGILAAPARRNETGRAEFVEDDDTRRCRAGEHFCQLRPSVNRRLRFE